jgi:hypothetical protein
MGMVGVPVIVHRPIIILARWLHVPDINTALSYDIQVFASKENLVFPALKERWNTSATREFSVDFTGWRDAGLLTFRRHSQRRTISELHSTRHD